MKTSVPGILLLYEDYLASEASTVSEHLGAFQKYSQFPVYPLNVVLGIPSALATLEFAVILFHYSLRPAGHWITPEIDNYLLTRNRFYKVAFFQDEIWYFKERLQFLNRYKIDCLYTRHKPQHWPDIYAEARTLKKLVFNMAGYVAQDLVDSANRLAKPLEARSVDVGYRGRRLPYYLGRAALEKSQIGEEFVARTRDFHLNLDIAIEEKHRLYGPVWHQFLANCKSVLGAEGGVSVIDIGDTFRQEYERLIREKPNLTFEEFAETVGERFTKLENRIDYRAFTPRHFEAAAFRNVQINFEGRYDGVMTPGVHYISLRKDFSNLAEVIAQLRDVQYRKAMVERTWQDLIGNGRYTYEAFVRSFDDELQSAGVPLQSIVAAFDADVRAYLEDWKNFRESYLRANGAIQVAFNKNDYTQVASNAAKFQLDDYAKRRTSYPVEQYVLRWRNKVQAEDRSFWKHLCRATPFDLGIGCGPGPKVYQVLGYSRFLVRNLWQRLRGIHKDRRNCH